MRKIEKDMTNAIRLFTEQANKAGHFFGDPLEWEKDNTRVTTAVREDGAIITSVYLNENLIFQTGKNAAPGFCLAGWNTPTTRSRINAILKGVYGSGWGISTKAGKPHIVGELNGKREDLPIPSNDWFWVEGIA